LLTVAGMKSVFYGIETLNKKIWQTKKNFLDSYSDEILLNVEGESDGWNQKITAINKILNDNNIEVSDDVWNDDELEDIINGI